MQTKPEVDYDDIAGEYESCVMWCARRGIKGVPGDPLPVNITGDCEEFISNNMEIFEDNVRVASYSLAMKDSEEL